MDDPRHGNPQPWPQHPQQPPAPGHSGPPPPGYGQPYPQNYGPGTPPQVVVVNAGAQRQYLAGMSTGENIIHAIITVCTLGLWAPIWWLRSRLRRKAIR